MGAFFVELVGVLIESSGSWWGQALIMLGIGVASYTGANLSITWLEAQMVAGFQGMGGDALIYLGLLKVGPTISVLFSALTARMVAAGMSNAGNFKSFFKK